MFGDLLPTIRKKTLRFFGLVKMDASPSVGAELGTFGRRAAASAEDIASAIRRTYPHLQNSGSGGRSLWDLYAENAKR
jgi:hypothetical protein